METQLKLFCIHDFYLTNDRWGPLLVKPPMKSPKEAKGPAQEVWLPMNNAVPAHVVPSSSLLSLVCGCPHQHPRPNPHPHSHPIGSYSQVYRVNKMWGKHQLGPRDSRLKVPSVQLPPENSSERRPLKTNKKRLQRWSECQYGRCPGNTSSGPPATHHQL